MTLHTYLMRSRPPSIGCQPDDTVEREVWVPAKEVDGRTFLGRVSYDRKLSLEEIARYELWPEDDVERLAVWLKDEERWVVDSYLGLLEEEREKVEKHAKRRDFLAQLVIWATDELGLERGEILALARDEETG